LLSPALSWLSILLMGVVLAACIAGLPMAAPPVWLRAVWGYGPPFVLFVGWAILRHRGPSPVTAFLGPSAMGLMLLGPIVLATHWDDVLVLDWAVALALAVLAALVVSFFLTQWVLRYSLGRKHPTGLYAISVLLATGYLYGLVVLVNEQFDVWPGRPFAASVLDKAHDRGRYPSWRVRVSPWGPQLTSDTYRVPPSTYDALRPGQPACIDLHRGALRLRWFKVAPCKR
jgi:hypothetical protein